MNNVVAWFCKSKGFSLIASVVSVLLTLGMTSEGIFVSNLENAFAQQGSTNMTTPGHIMTGGEGMQHDSGQGMSGMSGMTGGEGMQHDSGQGMSGMSGMTGGGMQHDSGQGMSGMSGMTSGGMADMIADKECQA